MFCTQQAKRLAMSHCSQWLNLLPVKGYVDSCHQLPVLQQNHTPVHVTSSMAGGWCLPVGLPAELDFHSWQALAMASTPAMTKLWG